MVYRVAGFLAEPKPLLQARSRLRAAMLKCLHGAGIEIASPSVASMRQGEASLPEARGATPQQSAADAAPDALIFDRADTAAQVEPMRARHAELAERIAQLKADGETPKEERLALIAALEAEQKGLDAAMSAKRRTADIAS